MAATPLCPICGDKTRLYQSSTTNGRAYFIKGASYGIAGGDYRHRLPIWRCRRCGHGATEYGVSPEDITAWYKRHELDTVFLADEDGRRRTAQRVLARIEIIKGSKGKLLDIGAGPGLFVSEALRRGWQIDGIEPADTSRLYAHDQLHISLRAGGVSLVPSLADSAYDVVTMFDVIEHLTDPLSALRDIHRILAPDGLLVITTPKFDSLAARILKTRWYSIFPAHLHYFTDRSMAEVLAKTNFQLLVNRQHVRDLSAGYVLQRFKKWFFSSTDGHTAPRNSIGRMVIPIALGDEFEVYARVKK